MHLPIIGDLVNVTIQSVAFGGDGVSRINDMVIFVPFAVDGDYLEVEITEIRKKYLKGRIRKILKPSPFRIEALCSYYTHCGGCQYQHVSYAHQLELKERQVLEIFERIGKFKDPPVEKIIPSPEYFLYRGHAEFHIETRKNGKTPRVGFMHHFDNSLVDVERCEIVDESINRKLMGLRRDLCDAHAKWITCRQKIWSSTDDLEEAAIKTDDRKRPFVTRVVKGKVLVVPRTGFFQANLSLTGRLVDCVIGKGRLTGREIVLDGYCGSGLFAFFLSFHASCVIGIEVNGRALKCAKMNMESAGFNNIILMQGDIADVLKDFVKNKSTVDMVVLDPPREGCEKEVMEYLLEMRPPRIIYVSCHCATQARDIRRFVAYGYTLNSLQPLDMFPQTSHIEVVAVLTG